MCGVATPPRGRFPGSALPAAFLLALGLLGAAPARAEEERPTVRLAMSGAFRPFSAVDARGRLTGFDADIAREIGRRLGRRPVLVQVDWVGIQAGLEAGKYELICGSMAITPERLRAMHFTLPYYVSGAQTFVRADLGDLRGARIGVTEDSTYADFIGAHPDRFPEAEVVAYGSEAEIVAALNTDKIDAFVSDRIVGGFYVERGAAVEIVPRGGLLYREACGIAAQKESGDLVREVNAALFGMVQDGTYAALYRKWVGADPDLDVLLGEWARHWDAIPSPGEADAGARAVFVRGIGDVLARLGQGALLTILLSLITAVTALALGAAVGILTVARSAVLRGLANGYVWVVRGTPLLVQLFISYFVVATFLNRLVGFELMGAFGAALLALVVNTTAYNGETLRGGIDAVPRGQWDAAASLGMRRSSILARIILPQAFRQSLPSLGNNLVVLVKDTSLVGAVTLIELTYSARLVMSQTGRALLPFLLAAGFYLVIITLLTVGVGAWERRLARSRQALRRTV